MLNFLQKLWPRRRLHRLQFVLYTRQGCHLCDEAWQLLQKEQKHWHFRLDKCDIDEDSSLTAQFGEQIPVVKVNGEVRFWGKINPILLSRLLQAEFKKG